jgi:N-acetylmuramic acid 6-phosphate etherase
MRATNVKLKDRSERILMEVCEVSREKARDLLEASGGTVKTAIVMHYLGVSAREAAQSLEQHGGVIRRVLDRPPPPVMPA